MTIYSSFYSDVLFTISYHHHNPVITLFASMGVNKIRFTGGEPTISNQLLPLIAHCKVLNIDNISITSNGIILKEQLDALIKAGK
jgi:cyclic pyranopterin phosphate synthase